MEEWIEVTPASFDFYGVNERFMRMPEDAARAVSDGVASLNHNAAGGRARFSTDAKAITLRAQMNSCNPVFGYDLYRKEGDGEIFQIGFRNPAGVICQGEFLSSTYTLDGKAHVYTLNFPLFGTVGKIELKLEGATFLGRGENYINEKPVVFYGSSITQGAMATRPGMTYEAQLSQRFNLNYYNLGFSGMARGEEAMARYIAGLDMAAFVLDYDHNSYDFAEFDARHEPFFRLIRESHPDLPILMLTRPDYFTAPENNDRRDAVVKRTYDHAVAAGDGKVRFIPGRTLFSGDFYHACTRDGCHPNDLGFYRMAQKIAPVLAEMLSLPCPAPHDEVTY